MTADRTQLRDWLPLIRGEYEELPDLQLTQSQVEELFGLDAPVAEALLNALVSSSVLKKTREGAYLRDHDR
jgi:hypothetical protein